MQVELFFALFIAVIVTLLIIGLRIKFKESVIFFIGLALLITLAIICYITFIVGLHGIANLLWGTPVGLVVFSISIFIIKLKVYDPIKKIEKKMKDIAEGGAADLNDKIAIASRNEIGKLAGYYNQFIEKMKTIVLSLAVTAEKMKDLGGNLAATSEETSSTNEEIRATIASMDEKVSVLKDEIDSASRAMKLIAEYNIKVNRLIEEQASAVSESSSSIQEMLSSLSMIEKNTEAKKHASDELVEFAKKGEATIKATFARISEISEATGLISGMLQVINTVAAQTSLLGMNAAIEAAHAGEFGRGFGVVADEIRKLAETSGRSAKDISKSLKSMIEKIRNASQSSTETGNLIGNIINGMADISESMAETLLGIREINMGTKQVTDALASLLELSEDVRTSSKEVLSGTSAMEGSMKSIAGIATENKQGMSEIASGMTDIAESSVLLARMSTENSAHLETLESEIGKFKIEAKNGKAI
jgi:methyl-accepting chemotaxis protein